jgi:GNAT superfamily N-acetyltransferase
VDQFGEEITVSLVSFNEVKEEIISILNRNRSSEINESYCSWRHDQTFGEEPITVLAETNGTWVGLLSLFVRPIIIGGKAFWVADIGEISVDEEYRGKGIFTKLLEKALEEGRKRNIDFYFCMPTEKARKALLKAGWSEIGRLSYFVKPINLKPKIKNLVRVRIFSEVLGFWTNIFLKLISLESFVRFGNYSFVERSEPNEEIDCLWQEVSKEVQISRIRNKKYLFWRFFLKPTGEQNFFELRKRGQLRGYAVIEFSSSSAFILDFFCSRSDFIPLMVNIAAYSRKLKRVTSIGITAPSSTYYKKLLGILSFIPRKENMSICCFANAEHDKRISKSYMDIRNWFITSLDKDTA